MSGAGFYTDLSIPVHELYPLQRRTLIVFQLDGVIADHEALLGAACARAMEQMGLTESPEVPWSDGCFSEGVCGGKGFSSQRLEEYRMLSEAFACEAVRNGGRMVPGVTRMLDVLSGHAVLTVLSDRTRRYCEQCVETLGLGPWIDRCSGTPEFGEAAERILSWQREAAAQRIILVGRSRADMMLARSVGADAICAAYAGDDFGRMSGADWTLGSPGEIAEKCLALLAHTF